MLDFHQIRAVRFHHRRLGATGLCYSKDTLLEVSGVCVTQIKEPPLDMDGTKFAEAVDDPSTSCAANLHPLPAANKALAAQEFRNVHKIRVWLMRKSATRVSIEREQQGQVLRIVAQINQLLTTENNTKDC